MVPNCVKWWALLLMGFCYIVLVFVTDLEYYVFQ